MWKYIIIAIVIWEIYKLFQSSAQTANFDKAMKKFRKDQERIDRQVQQAYQANERLFRRQAQEERARLAAEERLEKEQARQAKILEKHEKRIQTLEVTIEQAGFDIDREIANLDHYNDKLIALDSDLQHVNWEIEMWRRQKHLANVTKAEQEKEKIQDKIFGWEDKARKAEKRLAKARSIKEQAEKELSA